MPENLSRHAEEEFGAALLANASRLNSYARRLTRGGADADDLVQDTMLRCWSARHSFRAGSNLGAWARTVMRNSFLSHRRRDRFRADLPDHTFDGLLTVAENQSHVVQLRDARWALGELTSQQRDAVLLAGEGVSIEDGAARLGIPTNTFKSRVARGRQRLHKLNDDSTTPLLSAKSAPKARRDRADQRRDWSDVVIG